LFDDGDRIKVQAKVCKCDPVCSEIQDMAILFVSTKVWQIERRKIGRFLTPKKCPFWVGGSSTRQCKESASYATSPSGAHTWCKKHATLIQEEIGSGTIRKFCSSS
jgi:hypothetical protein